MHKSSRHLSSQSRNYNFQRNIKFFHSVVNRTCLSLNWGVTDTWLEEEKEIRLILESNFFHKTWIKLLVISNKIRICKKITYHCWNLLVAWIYWEYFHQNNKMFKIIVCFSIEGLGTHWGPKPRGNHRVHWSRGAETP